MCTHTGVAGTAHCEPMSPGNLGQLFGNSLLVIALFSPLLWHLGALRAEFPDGTPLLAIGTSNLLILGILLVLPSLLILRRSLCWCWLR